eukprot:TRINITY_DN5585_c0_g1_i1.p1 TRINITY_DN5585_c0_g1~~TRINITY_DN5585_c0_g1_i1.p1  ORF type:complete len:419 (-),score=124.68 TRINITY_DN5585_c0_g1_i1:403-1659(-)
MAQTLLASSVTTQLQAVNGLSLQKRGKDSCIVSHGCGSLLIEAHKKTSGAVPGKKLRNAVKAVPLAAAVPLVTLVGPASADVLEDLQSAFGTVQDVSKVVLENGGAAFDVTKDFVEQVVDAVKPAVEAAAPVVSQATSTALKAAAPVASDLASQAQKALQDAGVDTKPVLEAAKSVSEVAGSTAKSAFEVGSPYAQSTFETLLAQEPVILAAGAGALVLLYLLAPAIGSTVGYNFRGYAGDVTAAQALDLLASQDYTLIDVRTDKEKAKAGIPSLPRNAKKKFVSIGVEELSGKVKGQLRDPRRVEADVAAIKIAALKRINRGSNVILIDAYGDVAKLVAKSLTNLGFKSTYVLSDGFEGRSGWVQSRLQTDSFNLSFAEVFTPSRIISPGTTKKISRSTQILDVGPRFGTRLLPGDK